jgi:hypothetical protein
MLAIFEIFFMKASRRNGDSIYLGHPVTSACSPLYLFLSYLATHPGLSLAEGTRRTVIFALG